MKLKLLPGRQLHVTVTVKTIEQGVKLFNVNDKDTRTTPVRLYC